jgi:hypothetical protein
MRATSLEGPTLFSAVTERLSSSTAASGTDTSGAFLLRLPLLEQSFGKRSSKQTQHATLGTKPFLQPLAGK